MILIGISSFFTSCNKTDFDPIPLDELTNVTPWETTYTFSKLISDFTTPLGIHADSTRQNSGSSGLYTVDLIPSAGDKVIITGRVISADIEGNIYKSITIQEPGTGMGLKISIDVSSSSAVYPIGQLVNIECNGLVIGKYADMFQMGRDYYNITYSRTDNKTIDPLKTGYEVGRISYPVFKQKIQLIGMPDPSKIIVDTVTINQILNPPSERYYHSRLVYIKNVYFTGLDGDGKAISFTDLIFAPSTFGFGYPQSREITDGTGKISVSTSEYAEFAKQPIPASTYIGDITALVGWYKDKATTAGSWQLTLRSLGDLGVGFEGYLNEIDYK